MRAERAAALRVGVRAGEIERGLEEVEEVGREVGRAIAGGRRKVEAERMRLGMMKREVVGVVRVVEETALKVQMLFEAGGGRSGRDVPNAWIAVAGQGATGYLEMATSDIETRLLQYKSSVQELEQFVRSDFTDKPSLHAVEDVMRHTYDYFLHVASRVAQLSDALRAIREDYLAILRRADPDVPNPFDAAKRRDQYEHDEQARAKRAAIEAASALAPHPLPQNPQNPQHSPAAGNPNNLAAPATPAVPGNPAPAATPPSQGFGFAAPQPQPVAGGFGAPAPGGFAPVVGGAAGGFGQAAAASASRPRSASRRRR